MARKNKRRLLLISISLISLSLTSFAQNKINMELIHTLIGHSMPVLQVAYSPDGKFIASASGDGTIKIWDAESGKIGHTLTGHTEWVGVVAYSPNGKYIASGSGDETIK